MRSPFLRRFGMPSPFVDNEVGAGFSPAALFALNEPGVWLDPSDVANLDWRRNLLLWTQEFNTSAWVKNELTVTPNAAVAPDGTMTADKIIGTAATGGKFAYQSVTVGGANVFSFYAKAAEYYLVRTIEVGSYTFYATFNLQTGAVTATGGANFVSASAVAVGNGWYRCSIATTKATANAYSVAGFPDTVAPTNVPAIYTGDGTSGVFFWGAQVETGSVATDYQRISDVNTEVLERFPNTTLYQEAAGITAVTTPGQPVGLALDKSKGLVLGSEAGSISSGWTGYGTTPATIAYSSGVTITNNGTTGGGSFAFTTVVGRSYRLAITVANGSGLSERLRVGNSVGGLDLYNQLIGGATTIYVTATATTTYVNIAQTSANLGAVTTVSSFSVKELPGFHATQSTSANRPTYGIVPKTGRRNLLTFTEQFEATSAWDYSGVTVSTNLAASPVGSVTADRLVENTANSDHVVYNEAPGISVSAGSHTSSVYLKASGRNFGYVQIAFGGGATRYGIVVDLSTGAVTATNTVGTPTGTAYNVVSAGDGWWRISVTAANVSGNIYLVSGPSPTGTPSYNISGTPLYTGDGTSGILIWGAQLETGSTATAYQRVVSAFDVTEAGVPSMSYLFFGGDTDPRWMLTPTITPGIDKAQVFAGVRKLSDAAGGTVAEHSASGGGGAGSVGLFAPSPTAGEFYRLSTRGSASTVNAAATSSSFSAPITNVLTGLGDISDDLATLRVNGTQAAQSTADQGTGNYLAYPLYIGRRGGTALPFNGNLYSLIVRFGANLDAATISSSEVWVGGKTQDMFAPIITGVPTIGVA